MNDALDEDLFPEERRREALRLLEAILFAATAPVAEADLAARLPDSAPLADLLETLRQDYALRGVHLVRRGSAWTFRTAPDLAPLLTAEQTVPRKLSRAAVETLAIVAYHQPVTRAEIEEIRGVALSRGTLDTLLESGWIHPAGRRQTPGRPATWRTTQAFLDHFALETVDALPGVEELRAAGLLDARPAFSAYGNRAGEISVLDDTDEDDQPGLDLEDNSSS